jgi:hypothetical protein
MTYGTQLRCNGLLALCMVGELHLLVGKVVLGKRMPHLRIRLGATLGAA